MSRRFFKDVSVSTLQVIINQVLGFIVFILTSFHLPKEDYGELNWSFAIFTFTNTLLSLRLDQIVVKRSAREKDPSQIMTVFLWHVLISGVGFYGLLLLLSFIFPAFFTIHHLLLIVGISQLLTFIASPFKHVANGKERFDYLAIMSSINNIVRVILLILLIIFSRFEINAVLIIFIIGSFIELITCIIIIRFRMKIYFSRSTGIKDYFLLLKESVHQMGAAVLMAGITRIDWILLGIISGSLITAEYTFAYRVYELSPFPLIIIAPVLLSRFSKYFGTYPEKGLLSRSADLKILIRMEMIAATIIPLVLNIIWSSVMDRLTDGKYGSVNQTTFLILSACIPFQYISNIAWSALFAKDRLKLIFRITLITFLIVLIGDSICIPLFGTTGAAFVFLAAMIIEYFNYMRSTELPRIKESWQSLLICMVAAMISGGVGFYFLEDMVQRLLLCIPLYALLLLLGRQIKATDMKLISQIARNKKTSVPG